MFDHRMVEVTQAQYRDRLARAARKQQYAHLYRSPNKPKGRLRRGLFYLRNRLGTGLILMGQRLLAHDNAGVVIAGPELATQSQTSDQPYCP